MITICAAVVLFIFVGIILSVMFMAQILIVAAINMYFKFFENGGEQND